MLFTKPSSLLRLFDSSSPQFWSYKSKLEILSVPPSLAFFVQALPFPLTTRSIRTARGLKAEVQPDRPYAYLVEPECGPDGLVIDVATLFLTNRECPWTCLMCDLWKHTLDEPLTPGFIPAQIQYALDRLPKAQQIKLYNSGNFFDRKAIPPCDHAAIARLVDPFERVVVENHPKLCNDDVLRFRDLLNGTLEIALGLESIHPKVVPHLNKGMTLDDFAKAVGYLRNEAIDVRCFILLRPPFLSEEEGIEAALEAMAWAFEVGVQCCSLVPTRGGNGIMEQLAAADLFAPPSLYSMETVLEQGLSIQQGRVFMDLWDAEQFASCDACASHQIARIRTMNLTQTIPPPFHCSDCTAPSDAASYAPSR